MDRWRHGLRCSIYGGTTWIRWEGSKVLRLIRYHKKYRINASKCWVKYLMLLIVESGRKNKTVERHASMEDGWYAVIVEFDGSKITNLDHFSQGIAWWEENDHSNKMRPTQHGMACREQCYISSLGTNLSFLKNQQSSALLQSDLLRIQRLLQQKIKPFLSSAGLLKLKCVNSALKAETHTTLNHIIPRWQSTYKRKLHST